MLLICLIIYLSWVTSSVLQMEEGALGKNVQHRDPAVDSRVRMQSHTVWLQSLHSATLQCCLPHLFLRRCRDEETYQLGTPNQEVAMRAVRKVFAEASLRY